VRLFLEHLGKVGLMGAVAGGMLQGGSNLLRGRNFWTGVLKNEKVFVDYIFQEGIVDNNRNLIGGKQILYGDNAAKTSTSLGAGRTGVKQWLQNAGNLERGQLIKDIEGAGFKKVFDGKGMMHFERGGMKIRLDPPQPGTPFNHMHLNYGGNKSAYDIFLNPVNYKSPAAHIPIR